MKLVGMTLMASVCATALFAEEKREMSAHVHGVSNLELAVEDGRIEMNLLSPGMDIVGFEYVAESDADKDAVAGALRKMLMPEEIVALPEAAECRLAEVLVHLHSGDHDHDHEGHEMHEDHDHAEGEDHDHAEGEDHDHDDHDDHAHEDGHDHAEKEGHDHAEGEDHDHDAHADHDHEEGAMHSEFHARYIFNCDAPEALTKVGFPFFEHFAGAQEIEATFVTETGAGQAEIARDVAELSLQ